jgi:putative chitinase
MDISKLKGHIPDSVLAQIPDVAAKFEINTPLRLAHFLSQCGHESGGFKLVTENLNYGSKGLLTVFKKYFPTQAKALQYERKPEKIANLVYANRIGNGPEASGDGYKYRGRGAIQLTGHDNYKSFADSIDQSIDEAVAYTETLAGAIESACWFWNKNKLNQYADSADLVTLTKRINGGKIGLDYRVKHYNHNIDVLA